MLVVVGDTHGTTSANLEGRLLADVERADVVLHTGDFLTESVVDEFEAVSRRFLAVHGNNDSKEVCERVPERVAITELGVELVMVHGNNHSHTGLEMLGREEEADVVVFGHSHSPQIVDTGAVYLFNPGSYAVPRQFRPAYGMFEKEGSKVCGRLCGLDGEPFSEFVV